MGKSCAIYLRAADATQFNVDAAPRCDWAESALPPLAGGSVPPAHHIRALHAAAPDLIDRRQLRLRVRGARVHARASVRHAALGLTMPPHRPQRQVSTVNVMRLVLRWACTHCGCDVAEVRLF
jgi:hypothetical protein